MKKNILYTAIFSVLVFGSNAHADTSSDLLGMLNELEDSDSSFETLKDDLQNIDINIENNKIENNKIENVSVSKNKINQETVKQNIAENSVKKEITEEVESQKVVEEKNTVPLVNKSIVVNNVNYVQEELENIHDNDLEVQTDHELKKLIEKSEEQFSKQEVLNEKPNSNEHIYLLNIPIETKISANEDIYIYPYRDGLIYDNGKLINSSPLKYTDKTTYCYIAVKRSGNVRRFAANEEHSLIITSNKSIKASYKSNLDESKVIEKYETTFNVDNPHIKAIKCLSTEKELPLTISDFNFETGNRFKFTFPPVVDIFSSK